MVLTFGGGLGRGLGFRGALRRNHETEMPKCERAYVKVLCYLDTWGL